jgi:hypothetical protein
MKVRDSVGIITIAAKKQLQNFLGRMIREESNQERASNQWTAKPPSQGETISAN